MARNINNRTAAHFAGKRVRPIGLIEAELSGGNLRLWTGYGERQFFGDTYYGTGELLRIKPAAETRDLQANGATFVLSGIPKRILDDALNEPYQDNPITQWLTAVTDTGALLPAYPAFRGRMDTMSIDEGGETATITVTAENRLIDLQRAKQRRYTDVDQKERYPDDDGLAQVTALNDGRKIDWSKP
jgi:hypothetical protein